MKCFRLEKGIVVGLFFRISFTLVLFGSTYYAFVSVIRDANTLLHRTYRSAPGQVLASVPADTDILSMSVAHRRMMAKALKDIQREMDKYTTQELPFGAKWSIKLGAVAGELDPRLLSSENSWDYSARLPDMEPEQQTPDRKRHVCPEVYWGSMDVPFNQHGMEPENCTYVPKFSSVLTAILPAVTWTPGVADFVIKQIRKLYDIPIIVFVAKGEMTSTKSENVIVLEVDNNYDEADFMNGLIERVKTPFVWIGSSLTHFSNHSTLERLVRILDELKHVKVTAGAARDLQGRWQHGCLQQRMAVYQAQYKMGYYYSKYECMYCDDLLTPFVTYTAFLREIPFSEGLSGPALYRDWFAKVAVKGHLVMSCPDVMFFISNHTEMTRENWHKVAKKWILEKIHSFDDEVYTFDCPSLGITCQKIKNTVKEALVPPCCRVMAEKTLHSMQSFADNNNFYMEIFEGLMMGAVKMGGYLPWDFDGDVLISCKDYNKWLFGNQDLKKQCQFGEHFKDRYFTIYCQSISVEVFCHSYNVTSLQYLPEEYQNTSTKTNFSGKDITVISNPGLYNRNMYGFEYLKHSGHWKTLKPAGTKGKLQGGYENPGIWNPCKFPEFHSCLKHYPGDGNLPFNEPFLYL